MKNTVRIAMAQMKVTADDAGENLARADAMLKKAAGKADFAVLPECCDIGWGNPRAAELSNAVPGPVSDAFCDMAVRHGLYLAAGLTEKSGGIVYNSALLISPGGDILLHYRKINVCYDVTEVYSIGDRLGVAETEFGRVGIDICADNFMNSTAIAHTLARMGARLILSPASWAVAPDHDNAVSPYGADWTVPYGELSRLYDIGIVGVSNVGPVTMGKRRGWSSIGNSMAFAPGGEPVITLPFGEDAETLRIARLALMPSIAEGDLTSAKLKERGYNGI